VFADLNKKRILGVLAGRDLAADRIAEWARSAEYVLAADGGADILFENGIVPDITIGDFDSIRNSTKDVQHKLVYAPDQDSSDCDKLLSYAAELGYERITLCGAEGDEFDHVIGALLSAARSLLEVRLITRRGTAFIMRGPTRMKLDLILGTRLSLLPITHCSLVTLQGVEWPLVDAELSPLGLVSLSNRTVNHVQVSLSNGVAALYLSHPALEKPHWPD